MAPLAIFHHLCYASPQFSKNQTLPLTHSRFISSDSFLGLKGRTRSLNIGINRHKSSNYRCARVVAAGQSNFVKVLQTAWKVGKDGVEAGTSLVPDSVPRPAARIGVSVVAVTVALFVLKSFLSTAFFVLGTMGLAYFIFLALNKDEGPRGGGGSGSGSGSEASDDPVEEAKRIMEKYK